MIFQQQHYLVEIRARLSLTHITQLVLFVSKANFKINILTDVNSRKAILKSKGKSFVCLRSGHQASECKSTNKCYKCGSRRHLSICDFHFIPEKKTDEDSNIQIIQPCLF